MIKRRLAIHCWQLCTATREGLPIFGSAWRYLANSKVTPVCWTFICNRRAPPSDATTTKVLPHSKAVSGFGRRWAYLQLSKISTVSSEPTCALQTHKYKLYYKVLPLFARLLFAFNYCQIRGSNGQQRLCLTLLLLICLIFGQ